MVQKKTDMTTERNKALHSLKIARGQIEGIIHMIEDGRYCIDIADQLLATQSLIKKAELSVLQGHMGHCVREACLAHDPDEKLAELNKIMAKLINK